MALQQLYRRFLSSPTTDLLSAQATLSYLPSTVSISGSTAILKHLNAQAQQLKKKEEKVLNVIEGNNSVCLEIETTMQFIVGGGAYLPGLDDTFFADRTVTLPINKIIQARQMWDQGSLLKMVEVIGSRGRNWPLREGKDQIRLIVPSANVNVNVPVTTGPVAAAVEDERQSRRYSRGGAMVDKYASLSNTLFAPREEAPREESPGKNIVSPRESAKPPPRPYDELFVSGNDPAPRPTSPTKGPDMNPLKSGAGKHHFENRLFDEDPQAENKSPEKGVKTFSKKYNHFEFGNGEAAGETKSRPLTKNHAKQGPSWDFADFMTPEKPRMRRQAAQERHFGWSDDEEEASKPSVYRQHNPQPRKDAESHFEITDEVPSADKADEDEAAQAHKRPQSRDHGLYDNNIFGGPGGSSTSHDEKQQKMPLSNITNVNQQHHRKTFDSQFEIRDYSPAALEKKQGLDENTGLGAKMENKAHNKAIKTMTSTWGFEEPSPPASKGIKIAGDGMGTRKVPGQKSWWEWGET